MTHARTIKVERLYHQTGRCLGAPTYPISRIRLQGKWLADRVIAR
jgi:hypothetical protein